MTTTQTGAKLIEFLQLAFLQVLPTHLPIADYIVKGGANMRLFYDSRRRSQDIDLDYVGAAFWKVEDKVDETLASRAFRDLLRLAGVEMADLTKPKQTRTTPAVAAVPQAASETQQPPSDDDPHKPASGGEVVSLDRFRKK